MSGKIGEYSESHLLNVAKGVVEKKTADSVLLDANTEGRIPKFELKGTEILKYSVAVTFSRDPSCTHEYFFTCLSFVELNLGRVLGRGGFCVVNEVTKINLIEGEQSQANENGRLSKDEHYIHNIVQDRSFMARHSTRKGKDYRYAVKRVQDKSKKEAEHFVNAVVDLATEARFLAVIRHANIIKMRAMENASPYSSGFFVVLDKLYDIMPARLKRWKKEEGGAMKKMMKSKNAKINFWVERLSVAYDLSCALSYLHGMRYVYVPYPIGIRLRYP
jgi:serine/threonine protein kinase